MKNSKYWLLCWFKVSVSNQVYFISSNRHSCKSFLALFTWERLCKERNTILQNFQITERRNQKLWNQNYHAHDEHMVMDLLGSRIGQRTSSGHKTKSSYFKVISKCYPVDYIETYLNYVSIFSYSMVMKGFRYLCWGAVN